mgnify:CR=1 FL=1
MNTTKAINKLFLLFTLFAVLTSCKKEEEVSVFVVAHYDDYNSYQASYVGIQSITMGDETVPYDFEGWSNIGVGDIREIDIDIMSKEEEFTLTIVSSGTGSGVTKTATASNVKDGDLFSLDLDEGKLSLYTPSGGGGSSSGVNGNWERSDGVSYLKISGSSIYLCNGGSLDEFSGTYDAANNEATLVEGSTTLTFYIYQESSDEIRVEQYVSGSHVGTQSYYKTSKYPC